jgi:hypothetical protein
MLGLFVFIKHSKLLVSSFKACSKIHLRHLCFYKFTVFLASLLHIHAPPPHCASFLSRLGAHAMHVPCMCLAGVADGASIRRLQTAAPDSGL